MDSLLKGIPNTMVYLYDVLVTGPTEDEHLQTLDRVLERLVQAGFRLKESKCQFLSNEVDRVIGSMPKAYTRPVRHYQQSVILQRPPT